MNPGRECLFQDEGERGCSDQPAAKMNTPAVQKGGAIGLCRHWLLCTKKYAASPPSSHHIPDHTSFNSDKSISRIAADN